MSFFHVEASRTNKIYQIIIIPVKYMVALFFGFYYRLQGFRDNPFGCFP